MLKKFGLHTCTLVVSFSAIGGLSALGSVLELVFNIIGGLGVRMGAILLLDWMGSLALACP